LGRFLGLAAHVAHGVAAHRDRILLAGAVRASRLAGGLASGSRYRTGLYLAGRGRGGFGGGVPDGAEGLAGGFSGGGSPAGWGWALLGWFLLGLGALDARHLWLPDRLTVPLAVVGLAAGGFVSGAPFDERLAGAAAGFASLAGIGACYRWLRRREGLGLGDAKLLGALGAWFGWPALPFILLGATLLGLAWVLGQVVLGQVALGLASASVRRPRADQPLPLGTLLCLAAIPGWLASRHLLGG